MQQELRPRFLQYIKYEKRFKAYKYFFFNLSLYKQFICKRQITQCIRKCTEAY